MMQANNNNNNGNKNNNNNNNNNSITDDDKSHQRNESIYSMDSFVADFPSREGDKSNSPSPEKPRSHTYISPSSSAATTPASVQHHRNSSFQDTIDSIPGFLMNETPVPKQAPNPFFSPSYYDDASEVSDGSFIVHDTPATPVVPVNNKTGAQPPPPAPLSSSSPQQHSRFIQQQLMLPQQKLPGDDRNRFPSFDDSVASNSSIQYVQQKPKPPAKPVPPPNAPLTAQQIQQLPYHERRKLLAKRREQQERQSSTGSMPAPASTPLQHPSMASRSQSAPTPHMTPRGVVQQQQPSHHQMYPPPYVMPQPQPPPPPAEMYYPNSPLMMQQNQLQAHQYPLHHPHPLQQPQPIQQQAYGRPPYQGVPPPPVGPHAGYGNYPTAVGGMPGYYAPPPPPHHHHPMSPAAGYGGGGGMVPPPPPPMQQTRGQPPRSGKEHLQTTGLPRGYTGAGAVGPLQQSTTIIGRTRSSSLDSSDGNKNDSTTDKQRRPPPPPPPLGPPPSVGHHVRADSSGSLSSLDRSSNNNNNNHDDSNGETATKRQPQRQHQNKSFLAQLNPWAPKVPTVDDYHRKNQAFLQKASRERQRTSPSPSPKQEVRHRVPLNSMDRPPPSRGTHKRLPSIDNDNWGEDGEEDNNGGKKGATDTARGGPMMRHQRTYSSGEDSGYFGEERPRVPPRFSKNKGGDQQQADEKSTLLPPSGISSNEQYDKMYMGQNPMRWRPGETSMDMYGSVATLRADNTTSGAQLGYDYEQARSKSRKKKKKSKSSRSNRSRSRQGGDEISDNSLSSSSASSSQDYHRWMKKRARMLEKERTKLIKTWREEARKEEEEARKEEENNRWHNRLRRYMDAEFGHVFEKVFKLLTWAEAFVANVPLTINAIALAMANLGVVWFKFAEENMQSCEPVHYHSSQCSFPEFPGCFYCDTEARMYKIAVDFHWGCSTIAGILASLFICKLIIAPRVVYDELGSPTTAAPAGLFCMTLDIVFAGRGLVGQVVVSTASFIHLCLAIWFIYMALAYHIMPEPSWFPNTSSIGISAVKSWLYYPMAGHFLMAISLSLNFFFFPISLIRVAMNRKISATVGWMQMSAPNVSLYALTLMAQPSFEEEHPDINKFQVVHRLVYLPCMHVLFGLCILGMCASLHSLVVRWREFRKLPFSPAHAAFCVPTLSHANAVQAYRAAVNSFSDIPVGSPFKVCLYTYWVTVLAAGTIITLWIGTKFLCQLPEWTHIDTEGEIEPPAPYETAMTSSNLITTGETLVQPFVSPAILQANETGALVLARNRQGDQVYRRTRKVTALGFEPIMSELQMDIERDLLLDWVARNPPRRRHRTLSVPGIDFSYGEDIGIGTGNTGVYGVDQNAAWARRQRATTSSPYTLLGRKSTTPQPRYR